MTTDYGVSSTALSHLDSLPDSTLIGMVGMELLLPVLGTGEGGCNNKSFYNSYYSLSVNQSIDYPHKFRFAFQSVLANTVEQLDLLQSLSNTNLSNRPPSYF